MKNVITKQDWKLKVDQIRKAISHEIKIDVLLVFIKCLLKAHQQRWKDCIIKEECLSTIFLFCLKGSRDKFYRVESITWKKMFIRTNAILGRSHLKLGNSVEKIMYKMIKLLRNKQKLQVHQYSRNLICICNKNNYSLQGQCFK